MLNPKLLRTESDRVRQSMSRRADTADLDRWLALDRERAALLVQVEDLKHRKNVASEAIGQAKGKGGQAEVQIAEMKGVAAKVKELDVRVKEVEQSLDALALTFPNVSHESVPVGKGAADNVVVREWGRAEKKDARPHWEIGEALGLLDFPRAAKLSGSGFALFTGQGARLTRALIQLMLDLHTKEHGYTEVSPAVLVSRQTMTGTGQLPKFEEDLYRLADDDLFLIPTAEVPITNLHRDEILEPGDVPKKYTAYTTCFRREAGAHGKETRGLIRVHQFDKVELVKLVDPAVSYQELETLTADAERVFQLLEIPYRVISLCTGDLGFASAKTYDIEAWAPGHGGWLEVSSCSNFEDFQARRINLRFRRERGAKPEFVHTLNGSGVALPRTLVALLENHQAPEGKIRIPEALQPYLDGRSTLG